MSIYKLSELTGLIIEAFYTVYNTLGHGFLEKVYENALVHELSSRGHRVDQQKRLEVFYHDVRVGSFHADLIVDGLVIVEVKAGDGLVEEHEAQLLNYLKATHIDIGLLLNFGSRPQVKRRIFETARRSGATPGRSVK